MASIESTQYSAKVTFTPEETAAVRKVSTKEFSKIGNSALKSSQKYCDSLEYNRSYPGDLPSFANEKTFQCGLKLQALDNPLLQQATMMIKCEKRACNVERIAERAALGAQLRVDNVLDSLL
jgi:hypothetical protein